MNKNLKGISMFSGAGIGETYFKDLGVDILIANELLKKRADLYKKLSPSTDVICGDISDPEIFKKVVTDNVGKIDFILASPPCQGMSIAGKNRTHNSMKNDERNYLITYVIEAIKIIKPKYVIIENVPALIKLIINYKNNEMNIPEILQVEFNKDYNIEYKVLNSSDYGVPQNRLRAIIILYQKGLKWQWPLKTEKKVTVFDAIGHLPSLESGQTSNINWHFARKHSNNNIVCMMHTPSGETAFHNLVHFPKKEDGTRVKGYESSYRRISWNEPAPTITIRNDCIASQRNVHPGYAKEDGTYSDARVLTPLELMLLSSLPEDWNIPLDTPELLIRQCIGESIPPLMLKKIVEGIEK